MSKVTKEEYLIILQGDMTPFQRATLSKLFMKKAKQYNLGMAVNNCFGGELGWDEIMDKKNHPEYYYEEEE